MSQYFFERESRTSHSEQWTIENNDYSLGRIDIHFTSGKTHATLSVHSSMDDNAIEELIGEIDERLVLSADPEREDFIVTVWKGEEFGVFAEDSNEENEEND